MASFKGGEGTDIGSLEMASVGRASLYQCWHDRKKSGSNVDEDMSQDASLCEKNCLPN